MSVAYAQLYTRIPNYMPPSQENYKFPIHATIICIVSVLAFNIFVAVIMSYNNQRLNAREQRHQEADLESTYLKPGKFWVELRPVSYKRNRLAPTRVTGIANNGVFSDDVWVEARIITRPVNSLLKDQLDGVGRHVDGVVAPNEGKLKVGALPAADGMGLRTL